MPRLPVQFKHLSIALGILGMSSILLVASLNGGPRKPAASPSATPSPRITPSPTPSPFEASPAETAITLIVLTIAGIVFYFVPTIIAVARKHPSTGSILVINFLLGWICIGWIVALAWSLSAIDTTRTYR